MHGAVTVSEHGATTVSKHGAATLSEYGAAAVSGHGGVMRSGTDEETVKKRGVESGDACQKIVEPGTYSALRSDENFRASIFFQMTVYACVRVIFVRE